MNTIDSLTPSPQPASENVFVNLETTNTDTSTTDITVTEIREPNVVSHPERYHVAVDRFTIHKGFLPVFENVHTLQIKIIRKSDAAEFTRTADFSSYVDVNGLIYDANYFVAALNQVLTDLCSTDLSIGVLVFTIANGSWVMTLDYSAQAAFGDDYYIEVNHNLYGILDSFEYRDVVGGAQDFFRLYTPNTSPYTMDSYEGVALSPVDKILVKSNQMPLQYEYTPANSANNATRNSEPILTDFDFNGANKKAYSNISFSANGQYRFHSMKQTTSFNTIDLRFYYKTFNNNQFPLQIAPSGSCNVKLLLKQMS